MQFPFRPKQDMKRLLQKDEPLYLTGEAIEKMKRRLKRIEEIELPQAIEDVRRTGEFGDFSENAEYQEAKERMRRLRNQAMSIKEQLKAAILIKPDGKASNVQIGSIVSVKMDGSKERTFHIVGPREADPLNGKLSFKSPLGARLMNREVGDIIELQTPNGSSAYKIILIR